MRAIHTQDGRDIITSVESSWLQLESSSKAEDEALIAEIVKQKMEKSKLSFRPIFKICQLCGRNCHKKKGETSVHVSTGSTIYYPYPEITLCQLNPVQYCMSANSFITINYTEVIQS